MAIKKSVRHPMLTWARVADTLECTGIHLNSLRATYWAVRRDLWTQRWRPGNSHSSTCHQYNPSVHSTGTTCGCHPPRRCWSGIGGPHGEGIASSPSGTAQADRIVSREQRKGDTQDITDPRALQTLRSAVLIRSVSSTSRENTYLGLALMEFFSTPVWEHLGAVLGTTCCDVPPQECFGWGLGEKQDQQYLSM